MSIPAVTKTKRKDGLTEYQLQFDFEWDGFDSFINYLIKNWQAEIIESADFVYSRRWVLRSVNTPISVYFDSQLGIYFLREDGIPDQELLEAIAADITKRMS